MGNTTKAAKNPSRNANTGSRESATAMGPNGTVEVLYQRLGSRWFAFSVVNDEVFMGEVPEAAIQAPTERVHRKIGSA